MKFFPLFSPYTITQFYLPRNDGPRIQIQEVSTGELREVGLTVNRNKSTNDLELSLTRHFSDPSSQAWFPDSSPWTEEELSKDVEHLMQVKN